MSRATLRRISFLVHVLASVGWVGAAMTFLVLAAIGLTADEPATVRAAYHVMEPAAWWTLVPFAVLTLVTGVAQSLITSWGLLLHYWVVFKLVIALLCTIVLLAYMRTFEAMAEVARSAEDIDAVRDASPALHASLAIVALVFATILAVFKPRGRTRRGMRALRG